MVPIVITWSRDHRVSLDLVKCLAATHLHECLVAMLRLTSCHAQITYDLPLEYARQSLMYEVQCGLRDQVITSTCTLHTFLHGDSFCRMALRTFMTRSSPTSFSSQSCQWH